MNSFQYLCHFHAKNGDEYFTNCILAKPAIGVVVDTYPTYEDLVQGQNATMVEIVKLLSPLPQTNNSIYCVRLNYRSHAKEANVQHLTKKKSIWKC